MMSNTDISPDVLEDGSWVRGRDRVWHWVSVPGSAPACPVCGAMRWQGCKSTSGVARGNHAKRRGRRTCPCGAALRPKALYCQPCAYQRDLVNKRDHYRRSRKAA